MGHADQQGLRPSSFRSNRGGRTGRHTHTSEQSTPEGNNTMTSGSSSKSHNSYNSSQSSSTHGGDASGASKTPQKRTSTTPAVSRKTLPGVAPSDQGTKASARPGGASVAGLDICEQSPVGTEVKTHAPPDLEANRHMLTTNKVEAPGTRKDEKSSGQGPRQGLEKAATRGRSWAQVLATPSPLLKEGVGETKSHPSPPSEYSHHWPPFLS